MGLGRGLGCGFMGAWMAWDSKFGKVRERERLLDLLTWTGRERVLDVGWKRVLMLVGATELLDDGDGRGDRICGRRKTSPATGPRRRWRMPRLERVADRVEVHTADMRTIPFPDGSFDTVLSMNAIHNIYSGPGRDAAIAEICRVLKPGGTALIVDIRHIRQYTA